MVIIELRFLGGRFHATPWGRHVNEGVPEWPPSPFRLLRALYDTWRRKASHVAASHIESLFGLLARTAPDFVLPRASASHTRSYLRQGSGLESDKSLVFDPFVVVMPDEPVLLAWPSLVLPGPERALLVHLLERLSYLGRTEALVSARLGDDVASLSFNCRPVDRDGPLASNAGQPDDIVQVACVAPEGSHVCVERRLGKEKTGPLDWFDAITWGTAEMLEHKLSDPPALRWVSYRRVHGALERPLVPRPRVEGRAVNVMVFALDGKVLPLVTETIAIAERFRRCAMGACRRIAGGDPQQVSPLLSGKDGTGAPLVGHRHAYYLPIDRDGDGRIDQVLVRCSGGLRRLEQLALAGVGRLWQSKGKPELRVISVAAGMADLLETGSVWTSATPFITPRHYRPTRGPYLAWLEEELRRALENEGLPAPSLIAPVANLHGSSGRSTRWIEFLRSRKGEAPRLGHGFRIEFPREAAGPFSVGYGSHFGLGAFRMG